MNSVFLLVLAAIFYIVASVIYGAQFIRGKSMRLVGWSPIALWAGAIGVVFHTGAIGLHCIQARHTPFTTAAEALSATGWAIAIVQISLELGVWRRPLAAVGALSFPLAFLAVFTGSVLGRAHEGAAAYTVRLDNSLISLHVVAILFAFGLLAIAVCCAVLYLVEHWLLKHKRIAGGFFASLPPLSTVDSVSFSLVAFAFPLLTMGILAGIIFAVSSGKPFQVWGSDAHTLASAITWAVYGTYLWMHISLGLRGVKANYLLLGGLVAAILTYIVPTRFHQFG